MSYPNERNSRPRASRSSETDSEGAYYRPLSLAQVEQRLLEADRQLDDLVGMHAEKAEVAARAKARWYSHRDRTIVDISVRESRTAADYREAKARTSVDSQTEKTGAQLYEEYKVATARVEAEARAIRALEARMSTLQTIAANIRNRT